MSRDFIITQALQAIDSIVTSQQQTLANTLTDAFSEYNSNPSSDVIFQLLDAIDQLIISQRTAVSAVIGAAVDSYATEQNELSGTMTDVELEVIIENETRPLFNKIDAARTGLTQLLSTLNSQSS